MENTFWNKLVEVDNLTVTTNGDVAYKSSLNGLMDLMFKGGVMKDRTCVHDMIKLFNQAWKENPLYAIRLLFYIRDCRGGQGCKLFFRAILVYLSKFQPNVAKAVFSYIPQYGCWADVIDILKVPRTVLNENIRKELFTVVFNQLTEDIQNMKNNKSISLLFKWLPSENTSSKETVALAKEFRNRLQIDSREYRKMLSSGRKYLDIVERKMCKNQFEKINYSAVPSVAMKKYNQAFLRHDQDRYNRYLDDVNCGKKKINASVLYPYDVIKDVLTNDGCFRSDSITIKQVEALWKNLPDFFNQSKDNSIVVADVSGSMCGIPIKVCLSLAVYIAERNHGSFHNKFITFSENPNLQELIGHTLEEKFRNLARADWGMNTDLSKVFGLLYNAVTPETVKDMPSSIYIISDMQFDACINGRRESTYNYWKRKFNEDLGIDLPRVIFWNVSECNCNTVPITVKNDNTILVSGFSPSIIKFIMNGATNTLQLIEDVVQSDRYKNILSEEQLNELIIS